MDAARILVIESDSAIAGALCETLRQQGHLIVGVGSSGADAIRLAAETTPTLILMDVHPRGSIDGIEAAEHIRRRAPIPILYIASHSDRATLQRAGLTEPYAYILKPLDARGLEATIQIALYKALADRKLAELQRWLTTTLSSIGDAVIATDTQGNITFLNPAAEQITGWTRQSAIGRDLAQVLQIVPAGSPDEPPASALVGLAPPTLLRTRSGGVVSIEETTAPVRDERGAVTGVVIIFRDVSERAQSERQLVRRATHDPLTSLHNRSYLLDQLRAALGRMRRHSGYGFAVLFLDLDRFKLINDGLGHAAGDQLLVQVARRIEACLRANDLLARLGGDEFVILLDGVTQTDQTLEVAERVHAAFHTPFLLEGQQVFSATSIGVALATTGYAHPDDLLRDADLALYQAKAQGKSCTALFDSALHAQAAERFTLEHELRRAISGGELELHYQPIVELQSGAAHSIEALARWRHPERGVVTAQSFLPSAIESGLIVALDWWALRAACAQLRRWHASGDPQAPARVSVNLSSRWVAQADLPRRVAELLREERVEPGALQIELSEQSLAVAGGACRQLTELGVGVALDNFGAGISSLAALRGAPLLALKIERSLVAAVATDAQARALVETIVLLAHRLGMAPIAEGIESEQQRDALLALGCTLGQGYLFGAPAPAECEAE